MSPPVAGSLQTRWVGALDSLIANDDRPKPLPEDAAVEPVSRPAKRFDFGTHNLGKYAECSSTVAASVAYLQNLSNQMANAPVPAKNYITTEEKQYCNNRPQENNSVPTIDLCWVEPKDMLDVTQGADSPLLHQHTPSIETSVQMISPLEDPWFQANFVVVDDEAPELESSVPCLEMSLEPDDDACVDMTYLDEASTDLSASTPPIDMSMRFDDDSVAHTPQEELLQDLPRYERSPAVAAGEEALMKLEIAELRLKLQTCVTQTDCLAQELLSLRDVFDRQQRSNSRESLAQVQWLVERREMRRELAAFPGKIAAIEIAARKPRTLAAIQVAAAHDRAQVTTTRRKAFQADLVALEATVGLRRSVGKELTATAAAGAENRARDFAEHFQRTSQSSRKIEKLHAEEARLVALMQQQTEQQAKARPITSDLGWQLSEAEVQIENIELRSNLQHRSETVSQLRCRLEGLEAARQTA